eukprot:CAMPEP_0172767506 /NCGR_PEP_ID=MMETSP1074-20121228/183034_1 /TAXON_ID=2916 /ORGANISM="Ceratium fusus, Strain PA161109" /LENGTH=128 /DNA_ID=CAMNT_0013602769 /DNA_START=8 /DNA_END=390 /DNA_ORIENTATION=+
MAASETFEARLADVFRRICNGDGPMTALHGQACRSQFDAEWFMKDVNPNGDSVTLEQFVRYFSTRVDPRDVMSCDYLLRQLRGRFFGLEGRDAASQLNDRIRKVALDMRHDTSEHHYTLSSKQQEPGG